VLAFQINFACACSNFGGLVTRSSNRFQLPRFQPMDWDGDRFADVVEGWYQDYSPDFLWRPVALVICMRLSLWRAAHVVVAGSAK
jgi:hypothetical protein